MPNRTFNPSGVPAYAASLSSAAIRGEFSAVGEGFTGLEEELDEANALVVILTSKTSLSANNIDLSAGSVFTKTITGNTTFTVSNVPITGKVGSFILEITNGGVHALTWWGGVKWPGGAAPGFTASGKDAIGFYTYDGGTTWTGLPLGKDIK